jgi:hypothetical protein
MIFITSEETTNLCSFAYDQGNDLLSLLSKGSIEKWETAKAEEGTAISPVAVRA